MTAAGTGAVSAGGAGGASGRDDAACPPLDGGVPDGGVPDGGMMDAGAGSADCDDDGGM